MPKPKPETLREFVLDIAAVELPMDGKADSEAIDNALNDLAEPDLWKFARKLWALVERARTLVGQPDRKNHEPLRY